MKKTRLFPIILIICLAFSVWTPAANALDDPELAAQAVVLADMSTGEIVYSKNMDTQRSPASLTKIMTVLLAVEAVEDGRFSLDEVVTAQDDCRYGLEEDSSTSGIVPGEQLTYENLLYCAMVQSANEACNVLASHISGSISAFIEKMNERAAEIGCENTHFADPNGLSNDNHYSTAYELYLITKEAVSHPLFMTICNTAHYDVPATNINEPRAMDNSNALITNKSIYSDHSVYEGAAGVKTGYTRAAGYCLISTATRGDISAIAVVLGCNGPLNTGDEEVATFPNSIKLYDWLFNNFAYRNVINTNEPVQAIPVQMAEDGAMATLYPEKDLTLLLPDDVSVDDIIKTVTLYEEMPTAPVYAGDALGELSISIGDTSYGTVKLVSGANVGLSKGEYLKMKIGELLDKGWILTLIVIAAVFAIIYIILRARYRRLRRKHLQERRRIEARRQAERARARAQQLEQERYQQPGQTQDYSSVDPDERYAGPADLEALFREMDEDDR